MTPDASQVTLEEYEHVALPRKLAERNPDSRYIDYRLKRAITLSS